MSKLDNLLANVCPSGVEYKYLSEVAHYAKERISVSKLNEKTYVSVENLLQNKAGKTIANSIPTKGDVIAFDYGNILIGNIRPYLRKIWIADCNGGTNGDVLVVQINDKKQVAPEYLYYMLSSEQFFLYDIQNSKGAKMPRGDKEAVLKYRVPVPPLEVQHEIVRILDNFTALAAELAVELTAELTARKKQYEYYRDSLFKFDISIPKVMLSDMVTIKRGTRVVRNQLMGIGRYPVYQNSLKPLGYFEKSNCPANTTFIISAGAAGEIGYSYNDFWAADDCFYLECSKSLKARYLYYALLCQKNYISSRVRKASIPRLDRLVVERLEIPVPSLSEQERIVSVLDRFDMLCNDLSDGLPAEIEARQKQYEYYRDKLLTFKELSE